MSRRRAPRGPAPCPAALPSLRRLAGCLFRPSFRPALPALPGNTYKPRQGRAGDAASSRADGGAAAAVLPPHARGPPSLPTLDPGARTHPYAVECLQVSGGEAAGLVAPPLLTGQRRRLGKGLAIRPPQQAADKTASPTLWQQCLSLEADMLLRRCYGAG